MGTDKDQQVLHSLCVASCGEGYGDINLYMFCMNIEQFHEPWAYYIGHRDITNTRNRNSSTIYLAKFYFV